MSHVPVNWGAARCALQKIQETRAMEMNGDFGHEETMAD